MPDANAKILLSTRPCQTGHTVGCTCLAATPTRSKPCTGGPATISSWCRVQTAPSTCGRCVRGTTKHVHTRLHRHAHVTSCAHTSRIRASPPPPPPLVATDGDRSLGPACQRRGRGRHPQRMRRLHQVRPHVQMGWCVLRASPISAAGGCIGAVTRFPSHLASLAPAFEGPNDSEAILQCIPILSEGKGTARPRRGGSTPPYPPRNVGNVWARRMGADARGLRVCVPCVCPTAFWDVPRVGSVGSANCRHADQHQTPHSGRANGQRSVAGRQPGAHGSTASAGRPSQS